MYTSEGIMTRGEALLMSEVSPEVRRLVAAVCRVACVQWVQEHNARFFADFSPLLPMAMPIFPWECNQCRGCLELVSCWSQIREAGI